MRRGVERLQNTLNKGVHVCMLGLEGGKEGWVGRLVSRLPAVVSDVILKFYWVTGRYFYNQLKRPDGTLVDSPPFIVPNLS